MIKDKNFIARLIRNTKNISASKLTDLLENKYKGSKSDLDKFLGLAGTDDVIEAVNKLKLIDFYFTTEQERQEMREGKRPPLAVSQSGHKLIRGTYKYSLEDKLESETLNYGFTMISHLMIFASERTREEFETISGKSIEQMKKAKSNLVKKRVNDFTTDLETLVKDETELRKIPSRLLKEKINLLKQLDKQATQELDKAITRLYSLRELHPELYEKSLEDFTTPVTGGTLLGWFKRQEKLPEYITKYVNILSQPKEKDEYTIQEINNFYGVLFTYYSLHNKINTEAHLSKRLSDLETIINIPEKIKQYGKQEDYEKAVSSMRKAIENTKDLTVFEIADLIDMYPVKELREKENYLLTQQKNINNETLEQEFSEATELFKDLFYEKDNTLKEKSSRESIPREITNHHYSALIYKNNWKTIQKYFQLKSASRNEEDLLTGVSINEYKEIYKNTVLSARKARFIDDYIKENSINIKDTKEAKRELKEKLQVLKDDDLLSAEKFKEKHELELEEVIKRLSVINEYYGDCSDRKIIPILAKNNLYSKSLTSKISKDIENVKEYQRIKEQEDKELYNKIKFVVSDFGKELTGLQWDVTSSTLEIADEGYIHPNKITKINETYNYANEVKTDFYNLMQINSDEQALELLNSDKQVTLKYENIPDPETEIELFNNLIKKKVFQNKMNKTGTHYEQKNGWVSSNRTYKQTIDLIQRVDSLNKEYKTNIKISILKG